MTYYYGIEQAAFNDDARIVHRFPDERTRDTWVAQDGSRSAAKRDDPDVLNANEGKDGWYWGDNGEGGEEFVIDPSCLFSGVPGFDALQRVSGAVRTASLKQSVQWKAPGRVTVWISQPIRSDFVTDPFKWVGKAARAVVEVDDLREVAWGAYAEWKHTGAHSLRVGKRLVRLEHPGHPEYGPSGEIVGWTFRRCQFARTLEPTV
jgi:hypothetical protein